MNPLTAFFASRKTIAGLFATLLIAVPIVCSWSAWNPQQRQDALTKAIYAVAAVWSIHMGTTAYEDGQEKAAGGTPDTQVNVSSDVKNTPPAAPTAEAPATAPQTIAEPPLTKDEVAAIFDQRFANAIQRAVKVRQQADAALAMAPQTIAQQDTTAGAPAAK